MPDVEIIEWHDDNGELHVMTVNLDDHTFTCSCGKSSEYKGE